jgi:hypothetical protein
MAGWQKMMFLEGAGIPSDPHHHLISQKSKMPRAGIVVAATTTKPCFYHTGTCS